MALAIEFVLNLGIGETLLFDALEFEDLFFGVRLECGPGLARLDRLDSPLLEGLSSLVEDVDGLFVVIRLYEC